MHIMKNVTRIYGRGAVVMPVCQELIASVAFSCAEYTAIKRREGRAA
jgi:hypothetical protein